MALPAHAISKLPFIVSGFICFTMISGCFDKNPIDSDTSQKGTDILNEAGFPLGVGNRWVYHSTTEKTSMSSDTTFTRWDSEIVWEITAKEQVLGTDAFRMETTQHFLSGPDSSKSVSMKTWFAAEGDTLRAIASGHNEGLNPLSIQLQKISGLCQDEPSDWSVNVLIFPLAVGKEWVFFRPNHSDFGNKVIEAIDNVSVPAGNFEAFRVVREMVGDNTNSIYDSFSLSTVQWFTSVGVVKMAECSRYNDRDYDEYNGNTGMDINVVEITTMTLVSYQIEK